MKTIRIVAGAYGADNGKGGVRVIERGQTCQVDDAEASRLISLGVAVEAVATAQECVSEIEVGESTPADCDAQERITGHLDAEQLSAMTNAQLKALADGMGIDASKCRKKADYIELITAEEVIAPTGCEDDDGIDDGELPPDLEAEAPVE